jgi:hypothetical protein
MANWVQWSEHWAAPRCHYGLWRRDDLGRVNRDKVLENGVSLQRLVRTRLMYRGLEWSKGTSSQSVSAPGPILTPESWGEEFRSA